MPRKSRIPSRKELLATLPTANAVLATSKAHAEFRSSHDVGTCFDSDLGHDHTAIRKNAGTPFVWAVSPHGTYMCELGTPGDCLASTCGLWRDSRVCHLIDMLENGMFPADYVPEGHLRLFLWDGHALRRHESADSLRIAAAGIVRQHARAHIAAQRKPYDEDVALAKRDNYTSLLASATKEIARFESMARDVDGWGPQ